jgi:hypothetical protein
MKMTTPISISTFSHTIMMLCCPIPATHFEHRSGLTKQVTKNFKHQQVHKEFILVNYNSLLHVSTLLGHLQGPRTPNMR